MSLSDQLERHRPPTGSSDSGALEKTSWLQPSIGGASPRAASSVPPGGRGGDPVPDMRPPALVVRAGPRPLRGLAAWQKRSAMPEGRRSSWVSSQGGGYGGSLNRKENASLPA
jgi:hypothetical protein